MFDAVTPNQMWPGFSPARSRPRSRARPETVESGLDGLRAPPTRFASRDAYRKSAVLACLRRRADRKNEHADDRTHEKTPLRAAMRTE